MIVAFTGIRDVDPRMSDVIDMAVLDEVAAGATELRFGGAIGSDTIALEAACDHGSPRRVVYVPFRVGQQPWAARRAIEHCADEIVELDLPSGKRAFLVRNDAMIKGVQRVVAFTDGRTTGGTHYTSSRAERAGIPVSIVPVSTAGTPRRNPQVLGLEIEVFAFGYYSRDNGDHLSPLIRRNKIGRAEPHEIATLVKALARFVGKTPALASATTIAAMPRRMPGQPSDMAPIAEQLAKTLDLKIGTLTRIAEPHGGQVKANRLRFPAEEHGETLTYKGPRERVIILDNVVTSGGSIDGAGIAVRRAGADPVGLAVLVSKVLGLDVE